MFFSTNLFNFVFFSQVKPAHISSFTVPDQGGYFTDDSNKLSVMIPNNALKEGLNLNINEISDSDPVLNHTSNRMHLVSKLYECEPDGKKFGNFLTIRLPLRESPNRKSKVALLYSSTTRHQKPNWVYFYDDTDQPISDPGQTLPQISWMIMNDFCVIMIDRFCLLGFGTEDEEEMVELNKGNINVGFNDNEACGGGEDQNDPRGNNKSLTL